MSKSLQNRSIALRNALDSGVLNLVELRTFLNDVENMLNEKHGPAKKPASLSFGKYMLSFENKPVKKRIAS